MEATKWLFETIRRVDVERRETAAARERNENETTADAIAELNETNEEERF